MVLSKRKRAASISSEDDDSFEIVSAGSDDDMDMDISSALTGKASKKKAKSDNELHEEDDEDLANFIKTSITKRDVKQGAQVIKQAKGKAGVAKGEVGGGSFQSMGLHPSLLRSLTLQGYRIPTPIQRLSIPALLENPPRDLVGMARTGSGKSLAYMVPLVQRLGGIHQTTFGARALILLPTRELAVQILKVGKELARGWHAKGDHAGDKEGESSKGQSLRWGLVVGGEGLDEQFEMITNNPDVIIATPGRLLHLVVEMNLDLKSIQYVVFDEADRLFEMGFETAMNELLHRLPPSRQTILFSATLPKSLVEFAKAGLQDPKLVRLDSESKISSDLKMAFFSVKQAEKEACLLTLLRDVIKVPLGENKLEDDDGDKDKKKKGGKKAKVAPHALAPHQTLIFAATKHHVEYLTNLLITVGYSVSHIYGSLDQVARSIQMDKFRKGLTNLLVVTDVAARGIDIPVLQNVVNYDFPHGARVFVHRVGRTARAGRPGWAWSFITNSELPYLLDLQLFLARPLVNTVPGDEDHFYTENLVLGTFGRETLDEEVEYTRSLDDVNHSLPSLRQVMIRGHTLYERSKGKASPASYKRAKEMMKDPKWLLAGSDSSIHPVLLRGSGAEDQRKLQEARANLLRAVSSFKPSETVFEVTHKGNAETAALMKERRKALSKSIERSEAMKMSAKDGIDFDGEDEEVEQRDTKDVEMADEEDIAAVFNTDSKKKGSYRDEEFYLSYTPKDADTERGYSLNDGASSFARQAQNVAFDLEGDDGDGLRKRNNTLTWDKKKKKFIKGDGVGADNVKMIRTESGAKLPATYRSGRFDEWKAKHRVSLPRVGEVENSSGSRGRVFGGKKYKHNQITAPKPLDKLDKNYERKLKKRKEKEAAGMEEEGPSQPTLPGKKGKKGSAPSRRYGGKSFGKVKSELKTVDQIRKDRKIKEQRKAKNARPSKKSRR
ncbi:ATP-dependent RNA helicase DBP10 [Coprinopsis cinerea okayama7|uniref:RNA helicase n=1 Tax=Coprinopsis cinerea (strain Okayama-7 / 130 / ATCC MYA-4618 / FGSC 9003) TaxID=240176 RepID=A8N6Y1_COPC7|nr:ATP-dependent RNA helicase DBP10 [Coprinopsis cinerea okayama7\|eukprot:XP_001830587.1 ATP-dependent RNA helicase DBP10 [Coprinopsis cinerea okayama7\